MITLRVENAKAVSNKKKFFFQICEEFSIYNTRWDAIGSTRISLPFL